MNMLTPLDLRNKGSLITVGEDQCLGYLVDLTSVGGCIYDALLGLVDVTPAEARAHNVALDEALLDGLDNNCQIGQGGIFYLASSAREVTTFLGTLVGTASRAPGTKATYVFRRGDRKFRGTLRGEGSAVFFKRVV